MIINNTRKPRLINVAPSTTERIDPETVREALGAEIDDFVTFLYNQRKFSLYTFGPGSRTQGIISHIRKELDEILQTPNDLYEWIDVVILALDGALRAGYEPEQVAAGLVEKLHINMERSWPDYRSICQDEPIEHCKIK